MIRNKDNEQLRLRGRTSICRPTLLDMGNTPRTALDSFDHGGQRMATTMPRTRYAGRGYFPSHLQVLALLMRCVPASDPQSGTRVEMEERFLDIKAGNKVDRAELKLCKTPLRWIEYALGGRFLISQIESLDDVYANDGPRCDGSGSRLGGRVWSGTG